MVRQATSCHRPAKVKTMHDPVLAPKTHLNEITTEWNAIRDPAQFVEKYGPAIRAYLMVLLKNRHDVDDVTQDFFVRILRHGFVRAQQERGRFRDYLKVAVRNAAIDYVRRKQAGNRALVHLTQVSAAKELHQQADREWVAHWRQILLDRACKALEQHQRRSGSNLFAIVLKMMVDYPLETAATLAERTSAIIGRRLRPEAFRKQVSRARRVLARLLVDEVAHTLDQPTPERIKEELIELSLWEYVQDFLPASLKPR
jgi:RNA polymerase sigma-70 factor (ECF subfamily)